jgi:hypothetical protein
MSFVGNTQISRSKLLCFFALFAAILTAPAAVAQGIHIRARGTANPSSGRYRYSDVVAEGNYGYLGSWFTSSGVLIIDISNPDAPKKVANYVPSNSKNMQGIAVLNGIGYFASDTGGGVHIVNLSDPTHPALITRITSAQGGYDSVHDLTLDGNGHLFIPDYRHSATVQVWNVVNPAAPFLETTMVGTDPSSTHDVTIQGNRLFMAGWGGTVDIWDITNIDTQTPVRLGSFFSGNNTQNISVTSDGNFLACPRELSANGEVKIFNITDPANAFLVASIEQGTSGIAASSPSETKIMGNLLFVSWYQQGLVVFDITDPTHPVMVGNYDTWPGPSFMVNGGGDGNWGVFPFLGLDRVLVSDRATGLYVMDVTGVSNAPAVLSMSISTAKVTGSSQPTGTVYLVGLSPSPSGLAVTTSSNSPAVSGTSLVIPAGATSGTFPQPTNPVASNTTATITATDGTYSASAALTVVVPQIGSFTFSPTSIGSAGSTTGRLTLTGPTEVDTTATLTVLTGTGAVASIPASVIIPAGFTSATFPVQANSLSATTTVQVSALLNGASKNSSFNVKADLPSSIVFSPTSVTGGTSSTGTVNFSVPVGLDTAVTLTVVTGASAVASIPTSVTVTAGTSSATFTLGTNVVGSKTTVQVSATANSGSKTGTLTVN